MKAIYYVNPNSEIFLDASSLNPLAITYELPRVRKAI